MKLRTLLFSFVGLCIAISLQSQSVVTIEGGADNGGSIETTINNDTRTDDVLIYELKRGEFYMMHGPINVDVGNRTIVIRAEAGEGGKPVILRVPLNDVEVGQNVIKGSLTIQNIQYSAMGSDGAITNGWGQFQVSGNNNKLVVEDCLFEFCNGTMFNTDGIENGQVAIFRNNYFRDFHDGSQWWAGRVMNCKVPVDTLIYENNTSTGAGLTVLGQECLMEYGMINHNTFINNSKYPFLNQYWKECYYTNNLFVNANWVGEDRENVATGGQDPDGRATVDNGDGTFTTHEMFHGLVGVDTITTNIWIDSKFYANPADSTGLRDDVNEISDYIWYAADNVCVQSSTLDAYYGGTPDDGITGMPASYLNWGGFGNGPWEVHNVPGIFMNSRTEQLVADHDNIKAENNTVYEFPAEDMGFVTNPLPQAAADVYVEWNRAQYGVPDVTAPGLTPTYFGDYDATTIPGVETETSTVGGITKISDMIEDFSYSKDLKSNIDGLPIGALHWDDIAFDPAASTAAIKAAYASNGIQNRAVASSQFELKNYPNPFGVSTTISFNLKDNSFVNLSVYDVSGRMVAQLINENRAAGENNVQFSPDYAASSTYFFKLTTDFGTETRKMMLLK